MEENILMMLQLGAIKDILKHSRGFSSQVLFLAKTERGKEYDRRFILNLKISFRALPIKGDMRVTTI